MSAMEPLSNLIGIKSNEFSNIEKLLIEIELFTRICQQLSKLMIKNFQLKSASYSSYNMEKSMFDNKLAKLLIDDILSTELYTLEGIAYYAGTHEDVIQEVAVGINQNPSAHLLRRIIELHREVRKDVYNSLIIKLTSELAV